MIKNPNPENPENPENPGSDKTENKSLLDTNLKNKYIKSHDETHINKRIKTKAY